MRNRWNVVGSSTAGCAALVLSVLLASTVHGESIPSGSFRARLHELRKERDRGHHEVAKEQGAESTAPAKLDYLNDLVKASWKDLGVAPSEKCSDGEFVRRVTLDIIGRIPSLQETKEFLVDRSSDKREKLIERLLASDEFGKNFANDWVKLLIPAELDDPRDVNKDALHAWLEREFNRDRPWNEMVHELIAASGRWDENPAVNFILANQDNGNTIRTTSMVTRLFLGVQTQCTECHDHPWNDWKQDQFHGVNAFFIGTREMRTTKQGNRQQTDYWELTESPYQNARMKGVFFERRNGLSVFIEPTYLDGRNLKELTGTAKKMDDVAEYLRQSSEPSKPIYLRQTLADAITSDENPYFARAIVNRMWYHFFGHSFTKDVDDFDNGLDEPVMPELLDRMAEDLQANHYSLKSLVRWIANSDAYSLSSRRKGKHSDEAVGFFAFQLTRPMSPEQLYDSILTLTQIDRTSHSVNASAERRQFISEFVRTFGTDQLPTSAPTYDGTITQSLMLMNSPLMTRATSCIPGSYLHEIVKDDSRSEKERVEAIYLAALSRRPTSTELREIGAMMRDAQSEGEKAAVYSDVMWAVINSAEFVLNH